MADTKISALTALTGANSAPGDLLDIVDVSDTAMAASGTNKSITREELQTFGLGTITTDKKVLDLSVTWNNAGVTFTGLKFNVTDSASDAASLLMDLQVGGASKFSVDKTGKVIAAAGASSINPTLTIAGGGGNSGFASSDGYNYYYTRAGSPMLYFGYERIDLGNDSKVTWSSALGGTADVALARDAANTLAQRNSTNAQTFNIYNTYTDASNYERLGVRWDTNVIKIGPQSAGTGSTRNLILISQDGNSTLLLSNSGVAFGATVTFGNNLSTSGQRMHNAARTSDGTESNAGYLITNRGASGTVTRTLATYTDNIVFKRVAAYAFRIEPSAGKSFRRANGTLETADKYLELGSDGATVHIVYDGTEFICVYESGTVTVEP